MSIDNNIYILPKGAPPVPKLAIAAIVILIAGVIGMIVYMDSKPGRSQETVPGQELIIGVDKATLYVPKDAATLDGVISISSLKTNSYSIAGEESEWFRSQVVDVQYLNRQGVPYLHVTFPKPVLICFKIKERWQDYKQHPDEYLVQYYAEEQSPPAWVTLPMSDNPDRYQLCGQTDHFSIFALAVKPQEEIPVTGGEASRTPTPTPMSSISPTPTPTPKKISSPGSSGNDAVPPTPVSTQAALTATSVALTATDVPPTNVPPTDVPPTVTDVPPTATNPPPTATDPPATDPPATDPPATDPPATDPPATDPPATDPPATDPPATDPPATDPPATDPPATDPPVVP